MKETWKDIKGYEGLYQVSDSGRVRSVDRVEKCGTFVRKRKGIILKEIINRGGYCQVNLTKDGVGHTKEIHRIVATAFIPNPLGLPQVNHIDCDKTNNSIDNLEWVTVDENTAHAILHNLKPHGDKHKSSKLNQVQVNWIRDNYISLDKFYGAKAMSERFGVSLSTIYRIISNVSWKRLEDFGVRV